MSHKCGVASVVMTGEPINRETAIACTDSADMICVYIRTRFDVIGRGIVVLHVLTAVITGDLTVPCSSESRNSVAVGCDYDVSVRCHYHEVPAIAPELTYSLLWSALTIKDSRVFLVRVKIGRKNFPASHLSAVGRRNSNFLYVSEFELPE